MARHKTLKAVFYTTDDPDCFAKERRGQSFAVMDRRPKTPDEEAKGHAVGPMYRVRFADGFETWAWPEQVELVSQFPAIEVELDKEQ